MICAVYARKSTAQDAVADEAKSITRQVAQASAYAAGKGWAVDEQHVYVDDGSAAPSSATGGPGWRGCSTRSRRARRSRSS